MTLNIAHRGARNAAPENTLAAFAKALEVGVDGIELDVQLSADGKLVVCHDDTVDRTSNGSGRVRDFSLDALRELDFGAWFDPAFIGTKITTLDDVLEFVSSRVLVNVEIKVSNRDQKTLARAAVETIQRHNATPRVIVSSFDTAALWHVQRLDPTINLGFLLEAGVQIFWRRAWAHLFLRPHALHPHHASVDARFLAWARRKNYAVNVWTVNDTAGMQRLVKLGVDSIITDAPEKLRRVLEEMRVKNESSSNH